MPLSRLAEVILSVEEMEALRLAHGEQLYQEEAARRMAISRPTFGRLLDEAHRKVTRALLEGLALRIEGGTYHLSGESCPRCGGQEVPQPPLPSHGGMMKIAVPVIDQTRFSAHFGRCQAFLVFETEGAQIHSRELRPNIHGHHAHQGHGHDSHHDDHHHDHGQHGHNGFISLLGDCGVVISAGMGPGALSALQGAGMRVLLVHPKQTPEAAVQAFLEGRLAESEQGACQAHG